MTPERALVRNQPVSASFCQHMPDVYKILLIARLDNISQLLLRMLNGCLALTLTGRRPQLMPGRGDFVGVGGLENPRFVEGAAGQREANRQSLG